MPAFPRSVAAPLLLLLFGVTAACGRAPASQALAIRTVNNLMVADVRVDGSMPLSFVLDTGAGASVIHTGTARALALEFGAAGSATTGGGSVDTTRVGPATVTIGSAHLGSMELLAIDLTGLRQGLGIAIDGILGYELYRRYVVEHDYRASRVTLHEPAGYVSSGAGVVVPLSIEDRTPFATISVSGTAGRWTNAKVEFDTGQTSAMTLTRAFAEGAGLLHPGHPVVSTRAGALIPGSVPVVITRLHAVRIASVVLARPVVNITPGDEATGTSGDTVGLLGAEVLRRFRVIVDYARERAVLEPTAATGEPFRFDASGLSIAAASLAPPAFRVRAVLNPSPATESGIAVGDMLVAIDDRLARDLGLEDIRRLLRQPDRMLTLRIERGGTPLTVRVRTRDLLPADAIR